MSTCTYDRRCRAPRPRNSDVNTVEASTVLRLASMHRTCPQPCVTGLTQVGRWRSRQDVMAVVHELLFARRLILANGKAENVTSGRFQVTDQATSLRNDADQLVFLVSCHQVHVNSGWSACQITALAPCLLWMPHLLTEQTMCHFGHWIITITGASSGFLETHHRACCHH
jgi:hypothetical protein